MTRPYSGDNSQRVFTTGVVIGLPRQHVKRPLATRGGQGSLIGSGINGNKDISYRPKRKDKDTKRARGSERNKNKRRGRGGDRYFTVTPYILITEYVSNV